MPHPLWSQIAHDAGMPLDATRLARLDLYLDALIEWNGRLNLTRITDRAEAEVRHIADALTLLRFLPRPDARRALRIADVGTGGGVPGVPIAIARPDARVTLVDATKKKLEAIDAMLVAAGVTNATTLHARMEAVGQTFDVILARAVGEMGRLLEWSVPLMGPRSTLLAMKGPKAAEEITAIPMRVRKHFKLETVSIDLPELPGHVVVCVRRVGS